VLELFCFYKDEVLIEGLQCGVGETVGAIEASEPSRIAPRVRTRPKAVSTSGGVLPLSRRFGSSGPGPGRQWNRARSRSRSNQRLHRKRKFENRPLGPTILRSQPSEDYVKGFLYGLVLTASTEQFEDSIRSNLVFPVGFWERYSERLISEFENPLRVLRRLSST